MSAGSIALAQMTALRLLIGSGNKSDEKVRSDNPSNASKSFHFWTVVRLGRGSLTTFELRKPGKPEKKRSSLWSSSKQSNVHRKARVSISDGEFRAVSSAVFCMPCTSILRKLFSRVRKRL